MGWAQPNLKGISSGTRRSRARTNPRPGDCRERVLWFLDPVNRSLSGQCSMRETTTGQMPLKPSPNNLTTTQLPRSLGFSNPSTTIRRGFWAGLTVERPQFVTLTLALYFCDNDYFILHYLWHEAFHLVAAFIHMCNVESSEFTEHR